MNTRSSTQSDRSRVLLARGTGAAGLRQMRSSEEGVRGPGIYFYAGPAAALARSFAEYDGGVIVAVANKADVDYYKVVSKNSWGQHRADVAVVSDPSKVRVLGVIPSSETVDVNTFRKALMTLARRVRA